MEIMQNSISKNLRGSGNLVTKSSADLEQFASFRLLEFFLGGRAQCGQLGVQAYNFASCSFYQVFVMKISVCCFAITLNRLYIEILIDKYFLIL